MKRNKSTKPPVQALRELALQYPEAEEGTACTKSALKVRGKAFLFLGMDDRGYTAMLKLQDSRAEAAGLEAKQPDHYKVGGTGWVTVTFGHDESLPAGLLEQWIDESYRLLAPKKLVASLPERGSPTGDAQAAKTKRPSTKATKKRP